jgi:hypothetical protein
LAETVDTSSKTADEAADTTIVVVVKVSVSAASSDSLSDTTLGEVLHGGGQAGHLPRQSPLRC